MATLRREAGSEHLSIPLPRDDVKEWPLIGELVAKIWTLAATDFGEVLKLLEPQLKAFGAWLVKLAAGTGMGVLMLVFSVVIAGVLLAHSANSYRLVQSISRRLAGARGDELTNLAEATLRSVARGVLGFAVVQVMMARVGPCVHPSWHRLWRLHLH